MFFNYLPTAKMFMLFCRPNSLDLDQVRRFARALSVSLHPCLCYRSKLAAIMIEARYLIVYLQMSVVNIDMSSADREKCKRRTYNKIIDTSIESCHI